MRLWFRRRVPPATSRGQAMGVHSIKRYAMTPREKVIEEFYIGLIGRVIAAKDDEAEKLRAQLKQLAETVEAAAQEYIR